jgi:transposase InsO family protein
MGLPEVRHLKISIDFVGHLPRSKKGNKYMHTVSDCFTRWLEAFPCRRANAQVVVEKLITEIFPRFGVCDQIHSDRGTPFLSDLVSEVVAMLGIRQSSTPSYNPKSNPVERQHRLLGDAIKALTEGDQRAWEDYLPHALFAMRMSICVSTGVAPFAAMLG